MKNEETVNKSAEKKSRKDRVLRIIGIILCVISALALLGFGIYHGVLNYYLSKINIVTEEEEMSFVTQRLEEEIPEPEETAEETITGEPVTEEAPAEEIDLHGTFGAGSLPLICDTKKVTNILLLATDSRQKGGAGRSDVMMLVSINQETGKIVLCSFLRDLYAHYPTEPKNPINGGYDKLNHAHAYGGPSLTMAVLKETFNIDVKHYVKVDFSSFVQVVDAVGGVDLYLTAAEAQHINRYESANATESHLTNYTPAPLQAVAGMHHLNGVQALAHARNRSIGSDFQRTQRQRNVISAIVGKAGNLSLSQINHLLDVFLPLVTTNISVDKMKDLIGKIPAMLGYSIESTKVPLEGTYQSVRYNLIPDLEKNCYPLYEQIYGQPPAALP